MIRLSTISVAMLLLALTACGSTPGGVYEPYQPRPGQGQYVQPQWMGPQPTPRIPRPDLCQSRMFMGLIGQHEGSIYIAGLPGRKRILKPAFLEEDIEFTPGIDPAPPFLEVRDYLPNQTLYAPSIRTTRDLIELQPVEEDRLTIELDAEGYIQEVRCG